MLRLVVPSSGPRQPGADLCKLPGGYISVNELSEYLKKAIAERRTDQQVRDVDIGKAHVAIGFVYRGKLDSHCHIPPLNMIK